MEYKNLTKEEKLQVVLKSIVDNQPQLNQSLVEGRTNERFFSMAQWGNFQNLGLSAFFIDNDKSRAKQFFYVCGRLDEYLIIKHDEKILDYGINHLSYALLSDCKPLIERYANLKHSLYEKTIQSGGTAPMYILQCLIKDDWAEYERVMAIMKSKTVPKFKMELDAAFYEALAERNKVKMEEVLAEFVTPKVHKQRNKNHELINEFISHPALGYAKLAWYKGIEVEVNSPLVPKELLPVKPLDHYLNPYSFLENFD